jgi:hypothetical protein
MELVGEEKRIQALFSELRFEEVRRAPSFAGVWNRAQSRTVRPRSAFNLSFIAATALLVCALVSLAWWSRRWQQTQQPNRDLAAALATPRVTPTASTTVRPLKGFSANEKRSVPRNRGAARFAARRQIEMLAARRAVMRDAIAISSWQSPTAALLSSQNDQLIKSLPRLNESVNQLKSFLPSTSN